MKIAFAMLMLVLFTIYAMAQQPQPIPLPFSGPSVVYPVNTGEVRIGPNNPVRFQTRLPTPQGPQEVQQWHSVDLTPYGVPADADSVELSGLLIITHGTTAEIADLHVAFRPSGSTDDQTCANYIAQTVDTDVHDGSRTNMNVRVPLIDGKLEYCYYIPAGYAWPTGSSYGVNLSVMAYTRPLINVLREMGVVQ